MSLAGNFIWVKRVKNRGDRGKKREGLRREINV